VTAAVVVAVAGNQRCLLTKRRYEDLAVCKRCEVFCFKELLSCCTNQ
jgi:hypothetical protein